MLRRFFRPLGYDVNRTLGWCSCKSRSVKDQIADFCQLGSTGQRDVGIQRLSESLVFRLNIEVENQASTYWEITLSI